MAVGLSLAAFVLGAGASLATSWVLVVHLERVGGRLGLSEALLGMVAALAADAPEITASVTALSHHQQTIGAGVVIGSNVFNLAALLGLGAVVAGRIGLHRRVVLLGGAIAVAVSVVCLLCVAGVMTPPMGLAASLAVLVSYLALLAAPRRILRRLHLPGRWTSWLRLAVAEEEIELEVAIHPRRGTRKDVLTAAGALVVVVVASVAMERGASSLGQRFGIAEIVIGGLVLAAVTSLPNAVAAVYLARRGRGAAALSTALNSNTINVVAGLLIPATVIGLARPSASGFAVAGWYVGLTVVTLALAYAGRGLSRASGWLIIGGYVLFAASVLGTA
ncbi:MAG: sodium:calcium antiporter [Acidimicrobiales bacterium]